MGQLRSPFSKFLFALLLIFALSLLGPEEKTLGQNVRIVYLHGAWVMTAEAALAAAGFTGALGLLLRKARWHRWSAALGWTGMVFWITYLPLSMWAMRANWNGLFLAEPRFRLALTFAIAGVLLQGGLYLFKIPALTSLANILYILVLRASFSSAENVMHPPPSPIFGSGDTQIILFFVLLNALVWSAAYFLARALLPFAAHE